MLKIFQLQLAFCSVNHAALSPSRNVMPNRSPMSLVSYKSYVVMLSLEEIISGQLSGKNGSTANDHGNKNQEYSRKRG